MSYPPRPRCTRCMKTKPYTVRGASTGALYTRCVWCAQPLRITPDFFSKALLHQTRCPNQPLPNDKCSCHELNDTINAHHMLIQPTPHVITPHVIMTDSWNTRHTTHPDVQRPRCQYISTPSERCTTCHKTASCSFTRQQYSLPYSTCSWCNASMYTGSGCMRDLQLHVTTCPERPHSLDLCVCGSPPTRTSATRPSTSTVTHAITRLSPNYVPTRKHCTKTNCPCPNHRKPRTKNPHPKCDTCGRICNFGVGKRIQGTLEAPCNWCGTKLETSSTGLPILNAHMVSCPNMPDFRLVCQC